MYRSKTATAQCVITIITTIIFSARLLKQLFLFTLPFCTIYRPFHMTLLRRYLEYIIRNKSGSSKILIYATECD